jgi:hypothetical protein
VTGATWPARTGSFSGARRSYQQFTAHIFGAAIDNRHFCWRSASWDGVSGLGLQPNKAYFLYVVGSLANNSLSVIAKDVSELK